MTETHSRQMPAEVVWLGYGGLVPFVALAALELLDSTPNAPWRDAISAYGAVILSFVGALHWGAAMLASGLNDKQRRALYIWSVAPALLAWPACLMGPVGSSGLLIAGFLLHYRQDRRLAALSPLPSWYLPLRLRLTLIACGSLLVAAVGSRI